MMDRFEKIMIIFILSLFMSLGIAVFMTAYDIQGYVKQQKIQQETRDRRIECDQYYMDGTHRWKDCMGVGYEQ